MIGHGRLLTSPVSREMKKTARKMTKRSLAIPAAVPAIPPNPSRAAMSAMMRKKTVHPNIVSPFLSFLAYKFSNFLR
jgi:hypothetical protein